MPQMIKWHHSSERTTFDVWLYKGRQLDHNYPAKAAIISTESETQLQCKKLLRFAF